MSLRGLFEKFGVLLFLFLFLIFVLGQGSQETYLFALSSSFFWTLIFWLTFSFLQKKLKEQLIQAKLKKKESVFSSLLLGLIGGLFFPLVFYHQYSYAPPLSNLIFFISTVPFWTFLFAFLGKILFLKGFGESFKERDLFWRGLAVFFGLIGIVMILSNLEKPSSFAPLVRYLNWEWLSLLAAILFGFFVWRVSKLKENSLLLIVGFLSSGFIISILFSLNRGSFNFLFLFSFPSLLTGLTLFFFLLIYLNLLGKEEALSASYFFFFLSPLLVLMSFLERLKSTFLPNPIVFKPFYGGLALLIVGFYLVHQGKFHQGNFKAILFFLGFLVLFFSFVIGFLPAREYHLYGKLESGKPYQASWRSIGFEFIPIYLLILAGILIIGFSFAHPKEIFKGFLVFFSLGISLYLSGNTRLYNWFSFLPLEVSHSFGTEYVYLSEKGVENPYFLGILGLIGLSILTSLVYIAKEPRGR